MSKETQHKYLDELGSFLKGIKKQYNIKVPKKTAFEETLTDKTHAKNLTDNELVFRHVVFHNTYMQTKKGKIKNISVDDMIQRHNDIVIELKKRGKSHKRVDTFDDDTETFINNENNNNTDTKTK